MKQTLNDFFYLFLGLIAFCCSISSCDDSIDVPMTPVDEHEQVPVLLSLDFSAEADGYTPVPGSRSGLPFRAPVPGSRSGLASKGAMPPSRRAFAPVSAPARISPILRTLCTAWKCISMTVLPVPA